MHLQNAFIATFNAHQATIANILCPTQGRRPAFCGPSTCFPVASSFDCGKYDVCPDTQYLPQPEEDANGNKPEEDANGNKLTAP